MKRSYLTAFLIALAITGWVMSGQITRTASEASLPDADAATAQPEEAVAVRGRVLLASEHAANVVIRGRTEAVRSVALKAQTDGRVVELAVEKGSTVAAGSLICRLAVDDRAARLAEAEALARQRKLEYDGAVQLAAKGYKSETQAAAAKALLDAATAQVARMQVELNYIRIVAPFDGVVELRQAEIGDYLQKGDPCATIVDQDPFLVVGAVSERNIGAIKIGDRGDIRLLDGTRLEGTVRYLAKSAHDATRTFRIELEVANPDRVLRHGLTADIRVAVRTELAHYISPALLVLDEAGRIGVHIVDENDIVGFAAITIVADEPGGTWVTGLPARVTIITVGQEFVRPGDKVAVTLEDQGKGS